MSEMAKAQIAAKIESGGYDDAYLITTAHVGASQMIAALIKKYVDAKKAAGISGRNDMLGNPASPARDRDLKAIAEVESL